MSERIFVGVDAFEEATEALRWDGAVWKIGGSQS
jgi:hypothetical protein